MGREYKCLHFCRSWHIGHYMPFVVSFQCWSCEARCSCLLATQNPEPRLLGRHLLYIHPSCHEYAQVTVRQGLPALGSLDKTPLKPSIHSGPHGGFSRCATRTQENCPPTAKLANCDRN